MKKLVYRYSRRSRIFILALLAGILALGILPGVAGAQSIVDSTGIVYSSLFNTPQRHTFYAEGRWWIFYNETSGIWYRSSNNGTSWGSQTDTGYSVVSHSANFALWYDDTTGYLHTIHITGASPKLRYQRGDPQSDGSIVWDPTDDIVSTSSWSTHPNICVDTNGQAWVSLQKGSVVSDRYVTVYRNGNTDGTWSTDFTEIVKNVSDNWSTTILPLTGGKVVCLYADSVGTTRLYARRYDGVGGGFGAETYISKDVSETWSYSAVAIDDTAHIIVTRTGSSTDDTEHWIWEYSLNDFTYKGQILDEVNQECAHVVKDYFNQDVYIIWQNYPDTERIYFTRWDHVADGYTDTTMIVNEVPLDGIEDPSRWGAKYTTPYQFPASDNLWLFYVAGPSTMIKFKDIQEATVITTLDPQAITISTATFRGDIEHLGTGTIIERGFEYGLTEAATWSTYETYGIGFGTGVYSLPTTGLTDDTIYYVRAYCSDDNVPANTYYGEWIGFITAQDLLPEDPGDEGLVPDLPDQPEDWEESADCSIDGNLPGAGFMEELADIANVPYCFMWYIFSMVGLCILGFVTYEKTGSLLAVSAIVGMLFVVIAAWGILGLWALPLYAFIALGIMITERQYGF